MYQMIAKRQIRRGFRQISAGDFDPVLNLFAQDLHFVFVGDHALGADLHSRQGAGRWFERMWSLFPNINISSEHIVIAGPPWDMVATTRFRVQATLADGTIYKNHGVQVLRIRRGVIVDDFILEDTLRLGQALARLAALGHADATAAPLHDHLAAQAQAA